MTKFAKYLYGLVFILIIVEPLLIRREVFNIPPQYLQVFGNFILLSLAYVIYTVHQEDLRRKEYEKTRVEQKLELSTTKLNEAFEYIGRVNRELPLLQNVTTDLMEQSHASSKDKKRLFEELLASAVVSIAKRDWGMFRFVDTTTEKTAKEFSFSIGNYMLMKTKISNKELHELFANNGRVKYLKDCIVIKTTDRTSNIQGFLVIPKNENGLDDVYSTLQAITDQAQLYYKYLFEQITKQQSYPVYDAK